MICNECNNEITMLKKHLSALDILMWVILLCIPVIGWLLLIIDVATYIGKTPDRCPLCNAKVVVK